MSKENIQKIVIAIFAAILIYASGVINTKLNEIQSNVVQIKETLAEWEPEE